MRRRTLTLIALALAACAALALTACGGSSPGDAKASACKARDNIRQQVDVLQNITTGKPTPAQFKGALTKINSEFKTYTAQVPKLDSSLTPAFNSGGQQFTTNLRTSTIAYAAAVGKNASVSRAQAFLTIYATQIGAAYQQTLARVPCD